MQYRIGNGYDIHKLTEKRKLILGGIEIPFKYGLLGHSDADVLTHTIMDAMLGALCLGDIGQHFPPTDKKYKDISSLELLKKVHKIIKLEKYSIVNIDVVVQAEKPKLWDYIPFIKQKLSETLGIEENKISIKAKTMEGMDAIGEIKAMAAYAVVLLSKD
jgi:2-C-methyl-D-erythritol 2,4-cyclodiphosphate synthase